jgi:hypothetical protein
VLRTLLNLLIQQMFILSVPDFDVDSFVHEVRALDRHLSVKVDQSDAISVCTIVQAAWCFTLPIEFLVP